MSGQLVLFRHGPHRARLRGQAAPDSAKQGFLKLPQAIFGVRRNAARLIFIREMKITKRTAREGRKSASWPEPPRSPLNEQKNRKTARHAIEEDRVIPDRTMPRKRIALVYDAIYPFIKGGGEKRFHELGKQLVAEGYEVHLYGMKLWDGPKVIERDGLILHGIAKARPLYTKDGKRSISAPLLFGLSCFKLLGAEFDRIDCCGFPYFSLFPAKLAALLKRKPLYATWHEVWGRNYWHEYLGKLGFIGFMVEWLAARLPNRIIANSAQTAERLRTELHAKTPVSIIPNGIDTSYMFDLTQAEQASDLLYVGRLVTYKNVHLILKALAVLKENGTELRCTIIGDGPEKPRLQKLAAKLGIEAQVRWLSFIEDSSDLYRHMHAADLFVLPSEREGFGMVALEANACGTPVLTLDHPENAARHLIVPGKNGQLFHRTADHLASVIQSSRATSKAAWQKECRAVAQKFEWQHLGRELAEVYES